MIRALLIDLEQLLARRGQVIVDDLKVTVPVAEGKLKDSVERKVSSEGAIVTLEVLAAKHAGFVERGRRPNNKFPPLSAIKRWCEVKGIDVRAAFPIARSIAKKGIRPKHVLKNVLLRNEAGIQAEIRKAFGEAVKIEGENLIRRIIPTKPA